MSEDSQDIVTIKIAGIEYQLYCPPEEQSTLLEAGEILDKRIKSIKRKTRNLPIERVAVLAGLDVTNEFLVNNSPIIESPDKKEDKTQGSSSSDSLEEKDNPSEDDNLSLKLVDEISELSKL